MNNNEQQQNESKSSENPFKNGYLLGWLHCAAWFAKALLIDQVSAAEAYYTSYFHYHNTLPKRIDRIPPTPIAMKERPYKNIQEKSGKVYILKADNGLYKIGQTTHLSERIKQLGIQLPYELELVWYIPTDHVLIAEKKLHDYFADKRIKGEWFALEEDDIECLTNLSVLMVAREQ